MEGFKALIFDCYGTLIDWERGMYENLQPIFTQKTCPDIEKVMSAMGDAEHHFQAVNKTMPYPLVLKNAYLTVTGELRLAFDEDAAIAFGESVGTWPAFPDSSESLGRLKKLGLKLIILSNVDNVSFERTRTKLEGSWGEFDAVYTAEDIGSYKPDLRNLQYALEKLSMGSHIMPDEVLVVANSKLHDIEPAHKMGVKAAWINRPGAVMGVKNREMEPTPDFEFSSMDEFAGELERVRT